jgi:uncharacterized protein (DUF1810 family)
MSIETPEDPYGLSRFLDAQKESYATAVSELRLGKKSTHWIWYVFPQVDGLGFSETTRYYSIKSLAEARAYIDHPILGARLKACVDILTSTQGLGAEEIFGEVDTLKLRSCMTLFDYATPNESVFSSVLEQYFQGVRDQVTLKILLRGPQH